MTSQVAHAPRATLAECEAVIERGLATFVEVGDALAHIRDEKLYRASHRTFEDYCGERWRMSRPRAYEFIAAAETTEVLSAVADKPTPATERVVRELAPLRHEPERVREAWTAAVEKNNGRSPTAKQVREVVRGTTPKPDVPRCPTCGQPIRARKETV